MVADISWHMLWHEPIHTTYGESVDLPQNFFDTGWLNNFFPGRVTVGHETREKKRSSQVLRCELAFFLCHIGAKWYRGC